MKDISEYYTGEYGIYRSDIIGARLKVPKGTDYQYAIEQVKSFLRLNNDINIEIIFREDS